MTTPVTRPRDISKLPAPEDRRRHRHRRRRRKKRLSIPAPVVFYLTAALAALSTALVYLQGARFLGFSVGACVLVLFVLIVNDRSNFARSRRLRRSYETRVNFNKVEVFILFALLMLGFYVSVQAWMK